MRTHGGFAFPTGTNILVPISLCYTTCIAQLVRRSQQGNPEFVNDERVSHTLRIQTMLHISKVENVMHYVRVDLRRQLMPILPRAICKDCGNNS